PRRPSVPKGISAAARSRRRADPGKHCAFSCCCRLPNLRGGNPDCEMAQYERKSAHPTAARTERRSALEPIREAVESDESVVILCWRLIREGERPMWKPEHRIAADRSGLRYPSDLTGAEWAVVEPSRVGSRRGPGFE